MKGRNIKKPSIKQPLISVVVPIYNVEDYMERCICSVMAQTYKNLEIILVDDGSTDGSGKIADKYSAIKNIKVIHKENGGLASARNVGIKEARGEWILFVDSDDYVNEGFVEKLYSLTDNADIAVCSLKSFSYDGSILKKTPSWPQYTLSGKEAVIDMLKNKRPAYACLGIYRKSLFDDNNITFPEGREYEDILSKIQLMFNANAVSFTNEQLYNYLIRKDSITGKRFTERRYKDYLWSVDNVKRFLCGTECCEFLGYFESYSCFTLLNYLAREKNLSASNKQNWRSLRRNIQRLFFVSKYPSIKKRTISLIVIILAYFRPLYSAIYRKIKK